MIGRTARAIAALALSIVACGAGAAPAAAAIPDPFMGGAWPQSSVLTFRWIAGAAPPAAIRTAINAAADDANASRRSKAPTFDYEVDATDGIGYGLSAPCGVNGLACFRRSVPNSFSVYLREHGHRFDWGTLRWCEIERVNGCYDAENITLDELGHVLGLDHHDNLPDDSDYGDAVVQQYSRARPKEFYNAHVFGRCDYATLQQVYDVLTSSTPYSTCLDIPTELSINASRTSVVAGSVVTFTATLGSNGAGRLSNNLVSGRTVVLQQRTSGSWVDVFTMVPGSSAGPYSVGMAMRSTSDIRAVFRKPSNEGLRGSSSAAVPVTVAAACTTTLCPQSTPGSTR